jgi:glycolate oxidase FAD binding subunit
MTLALAEAPPATEAEVAEAVRAAAAQRRPLEIVGGGTRRALGRPVAGEALVTAGLAAVALYEPAALTLVAGAGARLSAIEAMLAAEGQRLPFEPMDHRALLGSAGEPTLGGVVACGVSGPRRIQAGACRDALIGVRFVDGRGAVIRNGGRVMKNVTGYDLVKLMAGAHGTLGVLTEVAFKLQPIPETEATVTLTGLGDAAAVGALSAALGSPYDVTGAAHLPEGSGGSSAGAALTLVRVEGFARSVAYRAAALRDALAARGEAAVEADPARSAALWRAVRDAAPLAGRPGAVWRLSVKPSDGPAAVAALRAAGVARAALYDWGGGLVWLQTPSDGDAGAAAIRAEIARRGGHATLVRATEAIRRAVAPFHPEPAPVAALSAALRARFDPAGVLNPGRMAA